MYVVQDAHILDQTRDRLISNPDEEIYFWISGVWFKYGEYQKMKELKPTKVRCVIHTGMSINNVPYYSLGLHKVGKNGKVLKSQVEKYRSSGEPDLSFFYTEEEAIEYYNTSLYECLTKLEGTIGHYASIRDSMVDKFINTDYVMEKLVRG